MASRFVYLPCHRFDTCSFTRSTILLPTDHAQCDQDGRVPDDCFSRPNILASRGVNAHELLQLMCRGSALSTFTVPISSQDSKTGRFPKWRALGGSMPRRTNSGGRFLQSTVAKESFQGLQGPGSRITGTRANLCVRKYIGKSDGLTSKVESQKGLSKFEPRMVHIWPMLWPPTVIFGSF